VSEHGKRPCGGIRRVKEDQPLKIVSNDQSLDMTPTGKVDAAKISEAKAAKASSSASPGQFGVPADAKLTSRAIDAATQASDIRPEVVARAKALLAAGKVGNDAHRLADALIDSLIKNE
jgi:anti-sigma28 factor (negative regulator of flagellin synthesis)